MKYILTIDTEKKKVSANLDRPIFCVPVMRPLWSLNAASGFPENTKMLLCLTGCTTRLKPFKQN